MSPIRSASAAGSNHALGDNRFAKTVTEVTATRTQIRKTVTAGSATTTITMAATPTIGNYLVVCVAVNSVVFPITCTYSGVSGSSFATDFTTGLFVTTFYIPVSSTSSGTTLNIGYPAGPTVVGCSVTEISGVYAASPVDVGSSSHGVVSSSAPLNFMNRGGHTNIGSRGFAFMVVDGAQTDGGYLNFLDMPVVGSFGNYSNSCSILCRVIGPSPSYAGALAGQFPFYFGTATSRNGVGCYVSFRPAA